MFAGGLPHPPPPGPCSLQLKSIGYTSPRLCNTLNQKIKYYMNFI